MLVTGLPIQLALTEELERTAYNTAWLLLSGWLACLCPPLSHRYLSAFKASIGPLSPINSTLRHALPQHYKSHYFYP